MKKVLVGFLILSLLLPTLLFRRELLVFASDAYYYSPCESTLYFSIGTIDEGFDTSREELIQDSIKAANIWNDAYGEKILDYDPASEFKINLVYDQRQELTSKIDDLNRDLEEKQNEIDPKIDQFKKDRANFEAQIQKLNQDITYWNNQGGAPNDIYEELVARQSELKVEAENLNNRAEDLGQQTNNYNLDAKNLNQTIDDYRDVLNEKPEEGLYERSGKKRTISIFIDVNHAEFLHTLAHEMGHALGLEHTSNRQSIMYEKTNSVLVPSSEELAQLAYVCRYRSLPVLVVEKASNVIEILKNIKPRA